MMNIEEKELDFDDFEKDVWKTCWHLDTYWPTSFKHGMVMNMTEHYILIPLWMTLTFIQVTGLPEG